jgi:tripartite-type tricarboxylate transporter receptor subunit TctC
MTFARANRTMLPGECIPTRFANTLLFTIALAGALPASAQTWPGQPVRMIEGFPPGGVADAIPRYFLD